MLPGTLLGLFPGVVCDPDFPLPQTPTASAIRPFLQRFDGFWLDYEKEMPYPLPPPGTSYEQFVEDFWDNAELRGESDAKMLEVPAE